MGREGVGCGWGGLARGGLCCVHSEIPGFLEDVREEDMGGL